MTDPKDDTDPKDKQDATTPKKGGFGGFAQKYRDRWAGNHPDSRFKNVDHGSPSQSKPDEPVTKPTAEPDVKP